MIRAVQTNDSQRAFRALSDPTRRDIIMLLREQEMTIGAVCERFDITRAAIKKHLVILEEGQMISVHPKGRERINRFEPQGLKSVLEWLTFFNQYWDERLAKLKYAIEHEETQTRMKD